MLPEAFSDKVEFQIRFEMEQMDKLLNMYKESLIKCKEDEPSPAEIAADSR